MKRVRNTFFGENAFDNTDSADYSNTYTASDYTGGNILDTLNFSLIEYFKIETLPGVKFYINGNDEPVIVDTDGFIEIDLNNQLQMYQLEFDSNTFDQLIDTPGGYLFLDIVGE